MTPAVPVLLEEVVMEAVTVGVGLGDQTEGVAVMVAERLAVEERDAVKEDVRVMVCERVFAGVRVFVSVCVPERLGVRL